MVEWLLNKLGSEWGMIQQAPITFIFALLICVLILGGLMAWFLEWQHREKTNTQEQRILLLSERLDEQRRATEIASNSSKKEQYLDRALLQLHCYADNRLPQRLNIENIWRWHRFVAKATVYSDEGVYELPGIEVFFINFDQPVKVGTFSVSSPDIQLPGHEVKEFNPRFAIIVFESIVPQGTLEFRVAN